MPPARRFHTRKRRPYIPRRLKRTTTVARIPRPNLAMALVKGNLFRFKRIVTTGFTIQQQNIVWTPAGSETQGAMHTLKATPGGVDQPVTPTNNIGFFSVLFKYSDIPNFDEYAVLFDQYKILGVKLTIEYRDNVQGVQTVHVGSNPRVYLCKDYDDADVPTSIDEIRQYKNCTRTILSQTRPTASVYLKPRVVITSVVGNNAYQLANSPWCDMGSQGTSYFGVKGAISVYNNDINAPLDAFFSMYATYYVSVKGSR